MRALILVLTLNEIENIQTLLCRIAAACPNTDMLVVDDDSPDGTAHRANQMAENNPRLRVMIRNESPGLGNAMRVGLQYAVDHQYDLVVNLDADLSHAPEDIPRLIHAATCSDPQADLVIGSRYIQGGRTSGWSWRRIVISRLVNLFATSVLRLPVSDCSGGFRCYRVARLRELNFAGMVSQGYSIQEEILLKLHARGARMLEVPIVFNDRVRGVSKLSTIESLKSVFRLIQFAVFRQSFQPQGAAK